MPTLDSHDACATIDLAAGGRVSSLVVHGREILITSGLTIFDWGSYAMAPFAGRVRDGRLEYAGRTWQLPLGMPPHAIHGVLYDQAWRAVDDRTIEAELGDPWPFAGRVVQRFDLREGGMGFRLELHADEPMPASIGWHPWFARRIPLDGQPAGPGTPEVELDFRSSAMYERGADGIPTGRLVTPPPRPWDDCFVAPERPPRLRWPGFLELTIEADVPAWVVYDMPVDAVCVEPQTAPPNAVNVAPEIVSPGRPLVAEMTWRWRQDPG